MRWKLRLPNIIALLLLMGAVGSWFLPDMYHRDWHVRILGSFVTQRDVPPNQFVPESFARQIVQSVILERERLRNTGQYNAHTIEPLLRRLDWVADHAQVPGKDFPQEFSCDMECLTQFAHEVNELSYFLDRERSAFCSSEQGQEVCLAYSKERHALRPKLVQTVSTESVGLFRYKLSRSGIFVLLALAVMLFGRGQRLGWSFGTLFGSKLPQLASYAVAIGFSFCGSTAAVAQQILKKLEPKQGQSISQVLESPDDHKLKLPAAHPSFVLHGGVKAYPVTFGPNAGFIASPNYNFSVVWKRLKGLRVSGSGFAEIGERRNQFFSNNGVDLGWKKWAASFSWELCRDWYATCVQLGSKVSLTKVWGVQKILSPGFKSLSAGPLWRIRGPTHFTEIYLAWVTKEAKLPKGFRVNSEGFMRFRIGPKPAVGEPRLILRHRRLPHWQQMTEFWMVSADPTVRFGFQYSR